MKSSVLKFADDTKLFNRVNGIDDRDVLQRDLELATEWAGKWQMEFNVKKCKIMHIGQKNDKQSTSLEITRSARWKRRKTLGSTCTTACQ